MAVAPLCGDLISRVRSASSLQRGSPARGAAAQAATFATKSQNFFQNLVLRSKRNFVKIKKINNKKINNKNKKRKEKTKTKGKK